jgi:hypothetical protein
MHLVYIDDSQDQRARLYTFSRWLSPLSDGGLCLRKSATFGGKYETAMASM